MENIYKHIATTLKDLRQKKGWSLDKASLATGVSKAMLGQIEREESSPTNRYPMENSNRFETSFSSFIAEIDAKPNEAMHRTGQVKTIHPDDQKIRVLPLFPFDPQLNLNYLLLNCYLAASIYPRLTNKGLLSM